jgi:hypothetical protein
MQEALSDSWVVEHRRSFRRFVKMDACIYVLRRAAVQEAAPLGWMVMAVLSNLVEPQGSLRGKMVQLGMSSGLNIALRWCHLAKVKARQTWGS